MFRLEEALDNMRNEMRNLRACETATKAELSIAGNQDRAQKREIGQLRTKVVEVEQRADSLARQLDACKQQLQQNQSKLKKDKANYNAEKALALDQQKEMDQLRQLLHRAEREAKEAQFELRVKQQQVGKLEARLRSLEGSRPEVEPVSSAKVRQWFGD